MVSPTSIIALPAPGTAGAAFTFDPDTLILTASFETEQKDGATGYDGAISFKLKYGTSVSVDFTLDYKNCNRRLYWLADPVVDPDN